MHAFTTRKNSARKQMRVCCEEVHMFCIEMHTHTHTHECKHPRPCDALRRRMSNTYGMNAHANTCIQCTHEISRSRKHIHQGRKTRTNTKWGRRLESPAGCASMQTAIDKSTSAHILHQNEGCNTTNDTQGTPPERRVQLNTGRAHEEDPHFLLSLPVSPSLHLCQSYFLVARNMTR